MTHGRGLLNGRPVSSWDTMPNSKKLSMVSQDLAPPPLGCNLSTNRKRKPKWRRCVAASIAVGPSAILTGSRTRPSDWGSNARLGPLEDRRKNRRLATFTCTLCVLQLSVFSRFGGCHLSPCADYCKVPSGPVSGVHTRRQDSQLVSPSVISWSCAT